MHDLKSFREKIETYYKQKTNTYGDRYTQRELAIEIGLNKDELSKRLNEYEDPKTKRKWCLTDGDVSAIVRTLAKWNAITTQEQAIELLELMAYPHISAVDWKTEPLRYLRPSTSRPILSPTLIERDTNRQRKEERLFLLRSMLADHAGFLRDRLESFVGREIELAEIKQRITEKLQSGGYVTITGQAGQGKSSIIAKLIEVYGPQDVAYHFIPFNPGPDHQIGLLRNLMACLIIKYDLSDLYVASESRAALRDYFPKILKEIVSKGGQEVIFLDGLDQLEDEQSGTRDLSFLPNSPPPGIVFVLGTRPNDTLRPLELLKPHHEYKLPNISRSDFDLILTHRKVHLSRELANRFYRVMQENALYLDLVAKELAATENISGYLEVIERVADNPDNIFSLSIDRFKRRERQWHAILRPVLGLLLATNEPLSVHQIRQILAVEYDELRDGLRFLGGLITQDWQGRYYLFHLKLRDYLRQEEKKPGKEYIFANDEVAWWHRKLASWCEYKDLTSIWQDVKMDADEEQRRAYARQHYIVHLYHAKEWKSLWSVLDEGTYGRAKVKYDPIARTYAQDLDLGRQAASLKRWTCEEGVALLPQLWRYTLLRCSLTSRADRYSLEAFETLALLKKEEALNLAEWLTDSDYKVRVLLRIAKLMRHQGNEHEHNQLALRSYELARPKERSKNNAEILLELGSALAEAREWELAETVASAISGSIISIRILLKLGVALTHAREDDRAEAIWSKAEAATRAVIQSGIRTRALRELSIDLAHAQRWEWAEETAYTIGEGRAKAEALCQLSTELARAQRWKRAESIAQSITDGKLKAEALCQLSTLLAHVQLWRHAESVAWSIGVSSVQAQAFCQLSKELARVQQLERAREVLTKVYALVYRIKEHRAKAKIWCELGTALAKAKLWEQAKKTWSEAETEAHMIKESGNRAEALRELGIILAQAQLWTEAEKLAHTIEESKGRVKLWSELAVGLIKAKLEERAKLAWAEAETIAYTINGNQSLYDLCTKLARVGQWERARAVWAVAEKAIEINRQATEDMVLHELSELAKVQQWSEAEVVISSIKEDRARTKALRELGSALAEAEQWERAKAAWTEAEMAARAIKENRAQAEALCELSTAFARAQLWTEAETLARSITESEAKVEALCLLGKELSKKQQRERANSILAEAEAIAHTVGDRKARTEILRKLASAKRRDDQTLRFKTPRSLPISSGIEALDTEEEWDPMTIGSNALSKADEYERLLDLVQRSWLQADSRENAVELLPLATLLIPLKPEIGISFCEAFSWVDKFIQG